MNHELNRNIPGHANWQGSFYERLTEDSVWDVDAFWLLHLDLIRLAKRSRHSSAVERDVAYALVFLSQRISNAVVAHLDPNDLFNITGLTSDQLVEFRERLDLAILGAVTGEVVPESSFRLQSPLAKNG